MTAPENGEGSYVRGLRFRLILFSQLSKQVRASVLTRLMEFFDYNNLLSVMRAASRTLTVTTPLNAECGSLVVHNQPGVSPQAWPIRLLSNV